MLKVNTNMTPQSANIITASPTKRFFVEMLTRDIELEDAILDLLDNCVDGIQRITKDQELDSEQPYEGFWARITLAEDSFHIEDNCGGIPLEIAQNYAFRMGRPTGVTDDNNLYTIGTYGIGMKRAIFKMGKSSEVISQTATNHFKVKIAPDWLTDDQTWDLSFERLEESEKEKGTSIKVTELYQSISEQFSSENSPLLNSLVNKISQHYSFILHKGFKITVNDSTVKPEELKLLWEESEVNGTNKPAIAPYLYQLERDGIEVQLAVGFYRSTASEDEVEDEMEGKRRSKENAGWTIVCNDRVVVYCDKTRLTGWGEATVPSYHPQFIAISGIVHFRSRDPRKLPITTTKRGLDTSSDIYLEVKNYMREGLKLFTAYTNKWKRNLPKEKERSQQATSVSPTEVFQQVPSDSWTRVRNRSNEKKYKPPLPMPPSENNGSMSEEKVIKFTKPVEDIEIVSEYLFEDTERDSSSIGNECFEQILKQAKE